MSLGVVWRHFDFAATANDWRSIEHLVSDGTLGGVLNILGIDIGYSNLKLAFGERGKDPKTLLRPAGAAPTDRFGTRIDGSAHDDFLHVQVDGQPFVAGVATDRASMWSRSLHAEYASSQSYKALFHAGLLLSEVERIDILVTGLPVSQYLDETRRKDVADRMRGAHQVTPRRSIIVDAVKVIPQPVGGFLDYVSSTASIDLDGARVLVIDPGFFSVDWVVIAESELHQQSSGTSLEAASVVLEEASRLIGADYGSNVSTEKLENAIRQSKEEVLVLGKKVAIAQYVQQASRKVAPVIIETIQKSLRKESESVDAVLLVGGGVGFFDEAVRAAFPKLTVASTKEPVFSNARGFWIMGCSPQ